MLNGDKLEAASDFAAYLRAEKLNPVWAGIHNAWKAVYKGKPLLYIRLDCRLWNANINAKWVITPYLINLDSYEDEIIKEGLQDMVLSGFWYCKVTVNGEYCGNRCARAADKTILGKDLKGLCNGNFYSGRNWVWYYDPDEKTIESIKRLLEFEKQARAKK
jgi:hypothetical protein